MMPDHIDESEIENSISAYEEEKLMEKDTIMGYMSATSGDWADWDIKTIDYWIRSNMQEHDTFDFKEKISKNLERHIAAFANTSGGYLILGIAENKKPKSLSKKGFLHKEKDMITNQISVTCNLISPVPKLEIKYICENDVFYMVLKIVEEVSKKPFIVNNSGTCYIRVGSTTQPASRSTMINLFAASITYRQNVENLRAACILVKASLSQITTYVDKISPEDQTRPALVDLTLLKSSAQNTMGFIIENKLLGYTDTSSSITGITTVINILEQLNAQISAYNTSIDDAIKRKIKNIIQFEASSLACAIRQEVPKILDDIIKKTDEFLNKTKI